MQTDRHSPGEPDSYGEHNNIPLFQLLSRQSHGPLGLAIRDNDEELGHSTMSASREPSVQALQSKACLCAPASEETQGGSEGGSQGGSTEANGLLLGGRAETPSRGSKVHLHHPNQKDSQGQQLARTVKS